MLICPVFIPIKEEKWLLMNGECRIIYLFCVDVLLDVDSASLCSTAAGSWWIFYADNADIKYWFLLNWLQMFILIPIRPRSSRVNEGMEL